MLPRDRTIVLSGASFTETLPDAALNRGATLTLIHNGTSLTQVYTLATLNAQTIGGIASGSYALYTNGESLVLVSDGSNWQIVSHRTNTAATSAGVISLTATSAYTFTISSATVVAGDTYTNNTQTFTVTTSGTVTSMPCSGTGTPAASGTLTRASGTGPATLTFSAFTSSVPAFGTVTKNAVNWWREGAFAVVDYRLSQTGAGTSGTGDYILNLPTGLVVDTTIIPVTLVVTPMTSAPAAQSLLPVLSSVVGDSSVGVYNSLMAYLYSTTQFRVTGNYYGAPTSFKWGTAFGLGGANIGFSMIIRVPISGWQP
jgi:hypothetical protein